MPVTTSTEPSTLALMPTRDTPVDLAGLANLANIKLSTARAYRDDGRLPTPDGWFSRTQWWYTSTVTEWLANRPGMGRRTPKH